MILGYIANKSSAKFGFQPEWAKAFATAWDCGLNTESKLHRGIKVIVKYKDNKEQWPVMIQELTALVEEQTDDTILPYPITRAKGKKLSMDALMKKHISMIDANILMDNPANIDTFESSLQLLQ